MENRSSIFLILFKLILCIGFVLVVLPTHLTLVAFSLFARIIIGRVARYARPDLHEYYTDKGIAFVNDQPHLRPYTNHVWYLICEGSVSVENLSEQFQNQVFFSSKNNPYPEKYNRLRQFWTSFCGYLFWKWDEDFRLQNHIRPYNYTENGLTIPSVCTEEDLRRVMGPLMAKEYQKDRSPWELLVVPKYEIQSHDGKDHKQKHGCVIILRMHHGLADIISLIKLIQRLFDQDNIPTPQAKFRELSCRQRVFKNLLIAIQGPYRIVSAVVDAMLAGKNGWHNPFARLPQDYYTLFSDRIPVNKLKLIMKKYGVNSNAVYNTVVAGAVGRLMREAGQVLADAHAFIYPFPLPNHPGGTVNHL